MNDLPGDDLLSLYRQRVVRDTPPPLPTYEDQDHDRLVSLMEGGLTQDEACRQLWGEG